MEVVFHPLVRADVEEALSYYHKIAARLAKEFHDELRGTVQQVAENPLRFHLVDKGFRRANLRRFPYHVLYEIRPSDLRVMVVRHNKRHPEYGSGRK